MSKSMNMLRTRRRDNNVKPNRRLDRKSSRGMIYENEELRLKTININAEIERGQSDIKKLRRENEFLKREIWHLRDEYEKLDKLLKQKEGDGFTSTSSSCSSDSETSTLSDDTKEVETTQNLENVQKTGNMKNLHVEFDHLSVVPEEPSTENSDKSINDRTSFPCDDDTTVMLPPDQSYPEYPMTSHFFAPLPPVRPLTPPQIHFYTFRDEPLSLPPSASKSTDLIVKTDNRNFAINSPSYSSYDASLTTDFRKEHREQETCPRSTFSNGGNLEELLNDIQTISEDILKMSSPVQSDDALDDSNIFISGGHYPLQRSQFNGHSQTLNQLPPEQVLQPCTSATTPRPEDIEHEKYKSEISVMLMPTPMPLLGFEKYNHNLSVDSLKFPSGEQLTSSKLNLLGDCQLPITSMAIASTSNQSMDLIKDKKMSIRRKVSIHFKGRKQKEKQEDRNPDDEAVIALPEATPLTDTIVVNENLPIAHTIPTAVQAPPPPSPTSVAANTGSGHQSSDSERPASKHQNKSTSASPERTEKRQDLLQQNKRKKHKMKSNLSSYVRQRRNTLSTDRLHRERSFSICTDRSNLERGHYLSDDYPPHSDRERTNSLSSCGTNNGNRRKFSNLSQLGGGGRGSGSGGNKIPWCACWGNGCI